jgi:Orsellinic acid/F9775 biosynthesis cluster protein D
MAATLVLLVDLSKIHYNTRFRVLICEACHACINPTHVKNHFKKCHKHMKRKARLNVIDQLNEQIGTLQSAPKLPKQVRRPRPLKIYFELLAITQRIYFACSECDKYVTLNKANMRQHYNSEHQIKFTKNSARPYWSELEAQSFFD